MKRFFFSKLSLDKKKIKQLQSLFPSFFEDLGLDKDNFKLTLEDNSQPKIVYHYTIIKTLKAILKRMEEEEDNNKNSLIFRGTQIRHLNDTKEFFRTGDVIANQIKDYESKLNDDENKHTADRINAFSWIRVATYINVRTLPYVACFSENSNSLPMWNTYGDKGGGVAIGIKRIVPSNMFDEKFHIRPTWIKCYYDEDSFKKYFISKLIELDLYENIDVENGKLRTKDIPLFNDNLLKFFSILKHLSFEYEQEWRFVKTFLSLEEEKYIQYQEKQGIKKPYTEFRFPRSALKEVIFGPCAKNNVTIGSFRKKLIQLGYVLDETQKTKDNYVFINRSNIPYRNIGTPPITRTASKATKK